MGNPERVPPRIRALRAIIATLSDGMKAKDAVAIQTGGLNQRDRAFVMELVYGVLRHRDYIDWLLSHFIRNRKTLAEETINNLRMALYQMLFMRVPERAAVYEAVQIEKQLKGSPSLVNAVLRGLLRGRNELQKALTSIRDPLQRLAIETSHPLWIIKRWAARFGLEEAEALARKNNERPPLALRFTNSEAAAMASEVLAKAGLTFRASLYCPNCLILEDAPNFETLNGLLGTDFVIQDEASQIVTLLLDPKPEMVVLDACAAPGGKTSHLAAMMNNSGRIYAFEIDERRFELLSQTVRRLSLNSVVPLLGDVRDIARLIEIPKGGFDRILLDAPCSGIGVIRRNPDIKYRHHEADLKRFGQRQLEMLNLLSGLLRPGGIMLYAVCSTEPEEGEEVLLSFLQKNDIFSNIGGSIASFEGFRGHGRDGLVFYRTYPQRHNMDGFFAALIKRKQ